MTRRLPFRISPSSVGLVVLELLESGLDDGVLVLVELGGVGMSLEKTRNTYEKAQSSDPPMTKTPDRATPT